MLRQLKPATHLREAAALRAPRRQHVLDGHEAEHVEDEEAAEGPTSPEPWKEMKTRKPLTRQPQTKT